MSHNAAEQEARQKEQKYTFREGPKIADLQTAWAKARNAYFRESENRVLSRLLYGMDVAKEPARPALKINKIPELGMNPLFQGISPLSKHGVCGNSLLTGNEDFLRINVVNIAGGSPDIKVTVGGVGGGGRAYDCTVVDDYTAAPAGLELGYEVEVPINEEDYDYVDIRVLLPA